MEPKIFPTLTVPLPTMHNYIQQLEILVTALVYAFLSLTVNRMCKEIYSQTRLYNHPRITDNLLWPWGKKALTFALNSTHSIWALPPLIRTLSMAPLVLQIFQLKVGRPCNADATQISIFKCIKFNGSMNFVERTYFWRRSSLTSNLVHRSLRRTLARW